jgi:hypothetical protein
MSESSCGVEEPAFLYADEQPLTRSKPQRLEAASLPRYSARVKLVPFPDCSTRNLLGRNCFGRARLPAVTNQATPLVREASAD